ncbi:hypothetical protein DY000_02004918 [Brassica cretica]|uniref:Uncharacterized protein n=1 Tax=Brassica cretica TaxID=69181 RepID=A0ABQ7C4L6_BRACR|nr:hypothetical protein DY000_02004918 [Brassica cretica]
MLRLSLARGGRRSPKLDAVSLSSSESKKLPRRHHKVIILLHSLLSQIQMEMLLMHPSCLMGNLAESSGGFDQRDGFPKGASPSSGSTLLSTSVQMDGFMHGGGSISSTKDSLQPTTTMAGFVHEVDKNEHGSGQLRGGSSIVQKSSSYLFTSPETSSEPSDYSVNIASSSPLYSAINESSAKRNRPSFLDSLHISRAPETQYQHPGKEADLTTPSGSQLTGGDGFGLSSRQHVPRKIHSNGPSFTSESPYPFEKSRSPLFPVANGVMPGFTDYSMPKQNDDFSTLEQHIEDLTQEKFSLQRDLDASRALATSLASENSSMTDTYNQQVELESFRIEYANAQLECNAADERSQILAAEVISLEDKVLRLRSSELKLERELENAQAEISSYKKKLQSVEKDRQDLQSTIKALQEEKKVLQTMVQKASSGGKSTDLVKSSTSRKNASTSTEGLDTMSGSSNQETDSTALLENDQMRVIDNINTLIAELAIEKEELVQALSSELSRSAHVKELNKELSRKLEVQTQRLELLTAQNMAIDNVSRPNQPDSHVVQERPPIADEGDEGSRMDHEDVPRRAIEKKDKQAPLMHYLLSLDPCFHSVHPGIAMDRSLLLPSPFCFGRLFGYLIQNFGFHWI